MQTTRRPTGRLDTVVTSCMRSDSQDAAEQLTVKPYRAVRPFPEILLCVRLRLHRLVRHASRGRAVSVMARLWARDKEVREGTVDSTAAPRSVTLPPQISKDSSF